MDIQEIKDRTEENHPHYFDTQVLKFYGQTLKSFSILKQDNGTYLLIAQTYRYLPSGNRVRYKDTLVYFNPATNRLEPYIINKITWKL
tara:strand:- start:520 stop:783 length:264 start_codon:yes stop_codon:yes gene_type:complete